MEHFYLIANPSKEGTEGAGGQIMEYLRSRGASCEGSFQRRRREGAGYGYTDVEQIPQKTQCVITLGGDGTLIQAARDLVGRQLPLLGINMGTLGYLTQLSKGEAIGPMLDALLADNYRLEKRMMVDGRITGGKKEYHGIALNDIVLTRKDVMQVLKIQVFVNDEFLNEYTADGMIVSTPTGSTAYNLSAGGPIVTPGAELMVLTPICSHSLNARSIVVSAQDRVRLKVTKDAFRKQMAVFDGDRVVDLSNGESLEIVRSESYTNLIKLKNVSFLDNLRNKMARV